MKKTLLIVGAGLAGLSAAWTAAEQGQQAILEKLVPHSRVDDLEDEVKFLKSIVRQMNEDLQVLKKAQ